MTETGIEPGKVQDGQQKPFRQAERRRRAIQKRLSQVEPTRRQPVEERAAEMPRLYRAGYLSAVAGKASPREAIKAFCLECVGWEREEVHLCTGLACPLWAYRPFAGTGGHRSTASEPTPRIPGRDVCNGRPTG